MAEWRDVPGYEGLYQVSDDGRVRSLQPHNYMKEKKLSSTKGYMACTLSRKGRKRLVKVHRMVAEAFIPNPEGKMEVNHKNGIKADNRAENLEWVTSQENTAHAIRIGLMKDLREVRNKAVMVLDKTNGEVKEYRSITEAADALGIQRRTITKQLNVNEQYERDVAKRYYFYEPRGEANNAKEDNEH